MHLILKLEDPLYEIYIPLFYNDGVPIEEEKFYKTRKDLIDKFKGLTVIPPHSPVEGYWQNGEITYRDQILIYRVLSNEEQDEFFREYKEILCERFQQEEVLIIKTPANQL